MAIPLCDPEIGLWYRDIQNRVFEVIALEDDDTIEVQYYDGDISEYDRESWDQLCVNIVSDPGLGNGFEEELIDDNEISVTENLNFISWDNVIGDMDNEFP
jgi:hypothetical protein